MIERVASAKFASNIVLVDDGQSGQSYRLCTNFIHLNARTKPPFYPLPDQQAVRDQFSYSRVFSAMDLKAGFLNIPVS